MLDVEPERRGEDPGDCWCAADAVSGRVCWADEHWLLMVLDSGLPVMLLLQPRAHHDLGDLPDELAGELGRLLVAITAAVQALPSVGRAHVGRYGDGGAHLHVFFFGRPARVGQFRGSPLLDWEENLPKVPPAVADANAWFVAARLAAAYGGAVVTPEPRPEPSP